MTSSLNTAPLERIESRYNGDHDINPDPQAPPVTWAEMDLAHLLKIACEHIEALEARLDELEAGGYAKLYHGR
jgi:hypothetical protein